MPAPSPGRGASQTTEHLHLMNGRRCGQQQPESAAPLRPPFPWFGGKSRAAELVWDAVGDVKNYVEPFAGSLAVLLGRPHAPGTETVNDIDCYIANFWRALANDPEPLAEALDWPVNEADLHARHLWLVQQADFRERMKTDPGYYDATVAGWWVWGLCQWIGSGWCGVHRQIPHLGTAGMGELAALARRLRRVRVACGDWSRVLGESVTWRHGLTGVLLDPPYGEGSVDYGAGGNDSTALADDVRRWAIDAGDNPQMRIALCGYEGQHPMPSEWRCAEWKAKGGYSSQGKSGGNGNAKRERVWFSPHCLGARQPLLFSGGLTP